MAVFTRSDDLRGADIDAPWLWNGESTWAAALEAELPDVAEPTTEPPR